MKYEFKEYKYREHLILAVNVISDMRQLLHKYFRIHHWYRSRLIKGLKECKVCGKVKGVY